MANTKARHEEIYTAASKVLDEFGSVEEIDILPLEERSSLLRKMAKDVVALTDCHITSAKSNIAKALRRTRFIIMPGPKWGGKRPGSGRPPK